MCICLLCFALLGIGFGLALLGFALLGFALVMHWKINSEEKIGRDLVMIW